jgi:transcription elongation factor Elf1
MKIKRFASALILTLIIIAMNSTVAFAESDMYSTIESDSEVLRGEEIEFCISIVGGRGIKGIAIVPIFNNEAFSLVSGSWMINGMISDFSLEEGDGVIAFASPTDVDGVALKFTLRALDEAELSAQTVTADVIIINESGRREISTEGITVEIKCSHANLNAWKSDIDSHWQECPCGHMTDANAHQWNQGTVTKEPTESSKGEKTYTCVVCDAKKVESIEMLSPTHQWNQGTVTKEPTESSEGEKTYTCVICGAKKVESIEMLSSNTKNSVVLIIVAAVAVIIITVILVIINKRKTPPASPDTKKDEKVKGLTKLGKDKNDTAESYIEETALTEAEKTESLPEDATTAETEKAEPNPEEVLTTEAEKNEICLEKVDPNEDEKANPSIEDNEPSSIEDSESKTKEKTDNEVSTSPDTVEDKSPKKAIEKVADVEIQVASEEVLEEPDPDRDYITKTEKKEDSVSNKEATFSEPVSEKKKDLKEASLSTNDEESFQEHLISTDSDEEK